MGVTAHPPPAMSTAGHTKCRACPHKSRAGKVQGGWGRGRSRQCAWSAGVPTFIRHQPPLPTGPASPNGHRKGAQGGTPATGSGKLQGAWHTGLLHSGAAYGAVGAAGPFLSGAYVPGQGLRQRSPERTVRLPQCVRPHQRDPGSSCGVSVDRGAPSKPPLFCASALTVIKAFNTEPHTAAPDFCLFSPE